jgi:8-oxo-dGTP pyrophosphatase MutT (NUDIX family)
VDAVLTALPSFDPQRVAVVGIDAHLPKVSPHLLTPRALIQRFIDPLPWTPEFLSEPRFAARPAVHASVLIPLIQRERLTMLLTERTAHLSSHSGQVAFPGGKADADDANPIATALREAQEEVGLAPEFVQVIGQMPTYTTGSAFIVTPVVALVHPGFSITPNPHEVADVFEVPLDFLMDPTHHRHHAMDWAGHRREWLSMPYVDHAKERFIWGATAGMIRNLYRFLLA